MRGFGGCDRLGWRTDEWVELLVKLGIFFIFFDLRMMHVLTLLISHVF